jgi:hypothetical protein
VWPWTILLDGETLAKRDTTVIADKLFVLLARDNIQIRITVGGPIVQYALAKSLHGVAKIWGAMRIPRLVR